MFILFPNLNILQVYKQTEQIFLLCNTEKDFFNCFIFFLLFIFLISSNGIYLENDSNPKENI